MYRRGNVRDGRSILGYQKCRNEKISKDEYTALPHCRTGRGSRRADCRRDTENGQAQTGRRAHRMQGRGGSVEDLWPFNDEDVARAIYDCSIPVVSAVGHETDYTISDFAADMRAPTPSAAAELCTPEMESIMASLSAVQSNMTKAVKSKISERQARVSSITSSHAVMIPVYRIDAGRQSLSARIDSIDGAANLRLSNGRSRAREIMAPHVKMDIMHADI